MTITDSRPTARTGAGAVPRQRTGADGAWRLNVLGPVELCYDGVPVEVAGQTRMLLALLGRTPGQEVETSAIIATLWPQQAPEDAELQVATAVSRLRKEITAAAPRVDPARVVVSLPGSYLLAISPSNVDSVVFERLVAGARRAVAVGQPELALRQLDAATALWRGRPYQDLAERAPGPGPRSAGEAFARAEAERLEQVRLSAVEVRTDAVLALHAPGTPPELLGDLQRMVADHPEREHMWGQLMTVLVRLGRRADALAAHRRAQEELARRRIQPGAELRAFEEAVIDRDPRLLGVALRPTAVPAALATTSPPCVGREQELAWLDEALDLAATRRAQGRLIIGATGMGKSRLVAELAQRAAQRGVTVRHWRADVRGLETHVAEPDRLTLVVVEDLDRGPHEDIARVIGFIRATMTRPVVTVVTCRDAHRVGDLVTLPKLPLSTLDAPAIAEIVRAYAPGVPERTAVQAVLSARGVPGQVHRAASEWAYARAGQRIDRAIAESAEPRRALSALRGEMVAGALELASVRARARALRPESRPPGCPYPGLAGFGAADVELFHGRDRLVAQALARLAEAPLLALVGDPGAGKTSLLRAGLLPALAAGVLPDSDRWRQVVVTPSAVMPGPGVRTLAELLAPPRTATLPAELTRSNPLTTPTALLPFVTSAGNPERRSGRAAPETAVEEEPDLLDEVPDFAPAAGTGPGDVDELAELASAAGVLPATAFTALTPTAGLPALRLPNARTSAVDLVAPGDAAARAVPNGRHTAATAPDEQGPTLLVVDQFEEVFSLYDEPLRVEFIETLLAATRTGRVVVSLRSDFFRHCERYPRLAELLVANLLPVAAMNEDELREAIERPAQLAGLEVEPGLVERLVAEVQDGNGGLPHLAVTLRELWYGRAGTTLTLAAYQSGPGLANAVAHYADSVLASIPTAQSRGAARTLLAGLCSLTEDRLAVRARGNLTELLSRAGAGALPALEVLTAGGLVVVNRDTDTVMLRHDCLLTAWPRLRDTLDELAAQTALRRHLRRAANAWASGGKDPDAVYRGVRLLTALEILERDGAGLSAVEREFIAAGQRTALATETKRKRRQLLLWRWVAGTTALALLATAIAVVSVVLHLRTAATADRSDAARLGVQALAEPDTRRSLLLAVAATRLDPGQAGTLRTVLQQNPQLVAMAGEAVTTAAISPDGATVAVGTSAGAVLLLSAGDLHRLATLDYPGHGPVHGLTFTPAGDRLVSWGGSDTAGIVVWDVATRRPIGSAFGQAAPGPGGGLLADGVTLVLAQYDGDSATPAPVLAWNIDARTPSTAYPLPGSTVDSLVVSPDGKLLAFVVDGHAMRYHLADGTTQPLAGSGLPLAFSPDGSLLLVAAGSQVYAVSTAGPADATPRHLVTQPGRVLSATWAPDGRSFATVGADASVAVWAADGGGPLHTFTVSGASAAWFAADGRTLFVLGEGGSVLAFDLTGTRGVGALAEALADSDPELLTLACGLAGRSLTPDEWRQYLPGRPFQQVCP